MNSVAAQNINVAQLTDLFANRFLIIEADALEAGDVALRLRSLLLEEARLMKPVRLFAVVEARLRACSKHTGFFLTSSGHKLVYHTDLNHARNAQRIEGDVQLAAFAAGAAGASVLDFVRQIIHVC